MAWTVCLILVMSCRLNRPRARLRGGGHGAGTVAGVGLLVVFVPDGVAGPVLEIVDPPVPPGVAGDLGCTQVGGW